MESRHPHFTKRLKKLAFQQIIAMRMSEEIASSQSFLYARNLHCKISESPHLLPQLKKKLSSFTSGTGLQEILTPKVGTLHSPPVP
ncbi:hypothetical protein TNIN_256331 [Trichonephila inaurata madagascariensis]|uniref:Uncharacterized protein n=1 Tax=Trichonephila inaurata madagascariensis TaxID=2747483 RepID=A0A8X6X9T1_9ARAC|nr:hypothetical protein TNIN_256331 [Trichonephila inaurata madagascariensis]